MPRLALTFPTAAGPLVAQLAAGDTGARTKLAGLAVPIGVASGPSSDGYAYRFAGPPSNPDDLIDVVDEHYAESVVGRLEAPLAAGDAGLSAVARIFNTTAGRDLLELTAEGVKTGFSISAEFAEFTEDAEGVRDIGDWTALHLGVVRRPAFTQATGLTLAASAANPTEKETIMPPETGTTQTAQAAAGAAAGVVELPTIAELAAQVATHQAAAAAAGVHPLARFPGRTAFFAAFQAADEEGRRRLAAEFALVDQITSNNPGVMVPGWRTDIKMNLDRRRPAVDLTGGSIGLPDGGMQSNWPYFNGNLDALITEQLAEKTALNSVRVDILSANAPIKTAGVVSDISYQLLLRSSPSYLAAYQTIMEAAWARYTEAIYEAKLLSVATRLGALPADPSLAASAATIRGQLFEMSAAVEDATGTPATGVLVSRDVWIKLGGNPSLPTSKYGTQNAAGTADASTLSIDVNGLDVRRAPFFPVGTALATNDTAAKFAESGPLVATEEDVVKLGRDVATWGMYVPGEVYFPAGVVKLTPAP